MSSNTYSWSICRTYWASAARCCCCVPFRIHRKFAVALEIHFSHCSDSVRLRAALVLEDKHPARLTGAALAAAAPVAHDCITFFCGFYSMWKTIKLKFMFERFLSRHSCAVRWSGAFIDFKLFKALLTFAQTHLIIYTSNFCLFNF